MSQEYIDEYQNVHFQDKLLGRGGQGVVFRTRDPDLAIKLVTDESGTPVTDKTSVEKYSKRFKDVRLLPLPEKINIAVPAALIQHNAGYVMQLLSEMVPFSHFWLDVKSAEEMNRDDIPAWLSGMKEEEAIKIVHYYRTGGLRRRLTALYKCASLLARLHGNGLVYGDLSPNNIFISEGLDDSSVWLIDADNVRFEISKRGSVVYTPKYGAPELVQGKDGGRPASDCHAFAVVAFYLLSLIHPFIGKRVEAFEYDWADDIGEEGDYEEKAYKGLFPWVDDQNDDSNSSDGGLPRSLLLTSKLAVLFENTFGPGRIDPLLRPTIYHWPEALAQAADMTVTCPCCKMNYYYSVYSETDEHNCPYCSTSKPQVLILKSYRWNGKRKSLSSPCWCYIREIPPHSELSIPRRVFADFSMTDSDTAEVILKLTEKEILIKKSDHCKVDLSVATNMPDKSGFQKFYSQLKLDRAEQDVQFWMFSRMSSISPRLLFCSIRGGER